MRLLKPWAAPEDALQYVLHVDPCPDLVGWLPGLPLHGGCLGLRLWPLAGWPLLLAVVRLGRTAASESVTFSVLPWEALLAAGLSVGVMSCLHHRFEFLAFLLRIWYYILAN